MRVHLWSMGAAEVVFAKGVEKQLKWLPEHIVIKLWSWIDAVGHEGLAHVRKIPGYHDEPLRGSRQGQRSIRLSKAYRAFYRVDISNQIELVEILEVNKHDY